MKKISIVTISFNQAQYLKLAIESILNDKTKSKNYSYQSVIRAKQFTWEKCSTDTFKFISSLAKERIHV